MVASVGFLQGWVVLVIPKIFPAVGVGSGNRGRSQEGAGGWGEGSSFLSNGPE